MKMAIFHSDVRERLDHFPHPNVFQDGEILEFDQMVDADVVLQGAAL